VAEKAKILLVDDRAENLVALEAILSSLNQTLVPARSGDAALQALLSDEFAVVLLDVLMPGMDGFETAALIKRRPKTRDVPIIFLTALNAEPDYAFRSYSAGAVDYIAKPFDPWVLRAKVSVFVDLYTKNRQLRDQAAMLRAQLGDSLAAARAQRAEQAQQAEQTERAGAEPVLAELSARLAAVEDMVTVLSGQAEAGTDPAVAGSVHQLEHRVARLRGVFDALRVDT
jgi:CheY-like chemotaxis protein